MESMANVYVFKDAIEVVTCELSCRGNNNAGRKKNTKIENVNIDNRIKVLKRAKKTIRRMVLANGLNRFMTLTYRGDLTKRSINEELADMDFRAFMRKLNDKYENFCYCAVRERQKKNNRMAIHYHVLINTYLDNKDKQIFNLWGKGSVNLKLIKSTLIAVNYITKYLNKDADEYFTLNKNRKKTYLNSKGAKRNIELCKSRYFFVGGDDEEEFREYIKSFTKVGTIFWNIFGDITTEYFDDGKFKTSTKIWTSMLIDLNNKSFQHSELKYVG